MNSGINSTPIFIARTCDERVDNIQYLQINVPNLVLCHDYFDKSLKDRAYENFKKSLVLAGENPCVHLEDDIEFCENFYEKCLIEVNNRPYDVIQFFSMRKADIEIGSRYEPGSKFCMNQCYYLPKGLGLKLLDYAETFKIGKTDKQLGGSPYDTMMAEYFKINKVKYWVVVPNLVNHKASVSIIDKRRSSKRQSLTFKK